MRNMVFFVILAVLTVVALVGFNLVRGKFPSSLNGFPTKISGTPAAKPGEGTSLRNGETVTFPGGPTTTAPYPTGPIPSGAFTQPGQTTTKGGVVVPSANLSTVMYTPSGFSPNSLTVKTGTMVTFQNSSNRSMKIGGDSFTQSIAVGNGGLYQYQFTSTGTFNYKDLNTPSNTGIVVVTQ